MSKSSSSATEMIVIKVKWLSSLSIELKSAGTEYKNETQ